MTVDGGDLEEPERADEPPREAPVRERRALGYVAAGAAILLSLVTIVAAAASLDGGGDSSEPTAGAASRERDDVHDLLPEGASFPEPQRVGGVREGARAAGCELESFKVRSKDHVASPSQRVRYSSDPPTSGMHHPVPAQDAAYAISPDVRRIVHTLEHGRVAIWFDRDLPRSARASLKAFYADDPYQLLLVPDTTDMPYAVAATAWHRNPTPNGTGRLLGCREYNDDVYTALAAFRDENRGHGPELIP